MRRRLASAIALGRRVEIVARLDLDEGDRLAALDDEIDLAARDDEAARQHAIALQPQEQRGELARRAGRRDGRAAAPPAAASPSAPRAGETQRARVDLPSRQAGSRGDRRGGVLDRERAERLDDLASSASASSRGAGLRRADDDDDLALGRPFGRVMGGQFRKASRGAFLRRAWSVRAPPPRAAARVRRRGRRARRRAGSAPRRTAASPGSPPGR